MYLFQAYSRALLKWISNVSYMSCNFDFLFQIYCVKTSAALSIHEHPSSNNNGKSVIWSYLSYNWCGFSFTHGPCYILHLYIKMNTNSQAIMMTIGIGMLFFWRTITYFFLIYLFIICVYYIEDTEQFFISI